MLSGECDTCGEDFFYCDGCGDEMGGCEICWSRVLGGPYPTASRCADDVRQYGPGDE